MQKYDDALLARVLATYERRKSNRSVQSILFASGWEAKAQNCRDAIRSAKRREPEIRCLLADARKELAEQDQVAHRTASLDVPLIIWGFDADDPDAPDAVPHVLFLGQNWVGIFQCLRKVPLGCPSNDLGGGWSLVVVEWMGEVPIDQRLRTIGDVTKIARERLGVDCG